MSDAEPSWDKEWLHAERDLRPGPLKVVRYKTQTAALRHQTTTSLHDSTVKRTAFQELQRKPTMALPHKKNDLLADRKDVPLFEEHQIRELFEARCSDLQIEGKDKQFKRFAEAIHERCKNRRMNLTGMFLGPVTATLVARWMMLGHVDITHLLLG